MTSISKDPVVIAAANTNYSKLKEMSPDKNQNSIHNFEKISNNLIMATEISKYQASRRDLSVVTPKDLPYKEIAKVIDTLAIEEVKSHTIVDIYRDENLGSNESLTIKFVLQSKTKTLEEDDIVSIMNIILTNLRDKLNITLR